MTSCHAWCPDYTHIIFVGANDLGNLALALSRYQIGGAGYVDPVAFENVFEVVNGVPSPTFEPLIRVRAALASAVGICLPQV